MRSEPPVAAVPTRQPKRSAFGRVMSVLHGDKYMAGAYPPEWQDVAPAAAAAAAPLATPPPTER